jgi:predicted nucleic acid-binding Zn ribbon protein
MVCKNCGADLKPGIKYCLNCGNYIDEDDNEDDVSETEDSLSLSDLQNNNSDDDKKLEFDDNYSFDQPDDKTKKNKRKTKLNVKDMLIYGVLILIILVSLIVMLVSIVGGSKKKAVTQPTSTVVEDNVVKLKDYTIKFSGKLNYSQDGEVIYISDDENYTFSYRNSLDDYEKYSKDLSILENSLKKSGYSVLNSEKREIDENEFIIYKFKFDNTTKYLYVTKVDKKYITMGTIEEMNNGDWREALTSINKINKNIKFSKDSGSSSDEEIDNVINNSTTDLNKIIR